MSTQIAFRADSITTSMPADDNFAGDNSSIIITRQPSVGAISDAINNVRFACTGSVDRDPQKSQCLRSTRGIRLDFAPARPAD